MRNIPKNHPRADSLRIRHRIIDGMHQKIVAEAGLIAHGRGEAYDYLLGEKTHEFALKAIRAASAMLYLSSTPVISVNGNISVLCPKELIAFSELSKIPLEINLFYRSPERMIAIKNHLEKNGAKNLLGINPEFSTEFGELSSMRRIVDRRGIEIADTVIVPLEDGDRTIELKKSGKNVITIDLNPLSRTSLTADITVVDNVIRVFPLFIDEYVKIKNKSQAESILDNYNNNNILKQAMQTMTIQWNDKIF